MKIRRRIVFQILLTFPIPVILGYFHGSYRANEGFSGYTFESDFSLIPYMIIAWIIAGTIAYIVFLYGEKWLDEQLNEKE